MSSVSLRSITKVFRAPSGENVTALRELNLEIGERELVVIVGPSGCGKTTTLRLIAGLETPTSGDLLIDEKSVRSLPAKARGVAMVFQNSALYPYLTAAQNIAFGLELDQLSQAEIERRVREAAAVLNIADCLDRKPRALSGGQQRRVAVARALVRRPRVFLFDEPLTNLEPGLRAQLRGEIKRLHEQIPAAMIYVTHDHEEAMALADRLVVMRAGVIQQIDTPQQVYRAPANRFVAGFFGAPSMNFIHGTVSERAGKMIFRERAPGTLECPADQLPSELAGREVILGVRPEDVEIAAEGTGALVDLIEPAGKGSWVTLQTGAHQILARDRRDQSELRAGQRTRFRITGAPHFFDAETGQRLPTK